jgi:diguanylate cyclase (GGDEF)-like protein
MTGETHRARVVVVDDTLQDLEATAQALASTARVECCSDPEEALAALAREPADLVVSDLSMPGMSGLELLERIRREHPGTDVIILAASPSVDSAIGALRMGAVDYVRKPIQAEELALSVYRTLSRRRLLDENDRLRDSLRTVEECRALATCLESGEVYPLALDLLLRSLGRRRGIALFRRTSMANTYAVGFRGLGELQARGLREALVDEKAVSLDAFQGVEASDGGALRAVLERVGIETSSVLCVPIQGPDQETGVLWLLGDGRPFEPGECERARIVAAHAELAVNNADKYSRAKERAFVDDVTELYNARYLLAAVEHELRRAERYGTELSVMFLDLDRFKLVNDQHGHLVGSRCLKQLGQVMRQCVRQVDTTARYGGDEFTILLVDTDFESARRVAERIRHAVEEHLFEGARPRPLRLTVSVGLANYPRHARTRDALLDLADKAMYRAKSLGRNRVCTASELGD